MQHQLRSHAPDLDCSMGDPMIGPGGRVGDSRTSHRSTLCRAAVWHKLHLKHRSQSDSRGPPWALVARTNTLRRSAATVFMRRKQGPTTTKDNIEIPSSQTEYRLRELECHDGLAGGGPCLRLTHAQADPAKRRLDFSGQDPRDNSSPFPAGSAGRLTLDCMGSERTRTAGSRSPNFSFSCHPQSGSLAPIPSRPSLN